MRRVWQHPRSGVSRRNSRLAPASRSVIDALESRVLFTTYYVSPTGNDNNNGTTTATPWASVAKVDNATFQPGDKILFQRDGNWHDLLIASSSGTAANPITYGDYPDPNNANGTKPTFWGSDTVNNAQLTLTSGTYSLPISDLPTNKAFWVFQITTTTVTTGSSSTTNMVETPLLADTSNSGMPTGAFNISGSSVYFVDTAPGTSQMTNGGTTTTTTIAYNVVDRGDGANPNSSLIDSNGQSNIIFNNLIGRETAEIGSGDALANDIPDGYVFRVQGGSNVQMTNDETYFGSKHNVGAIDTTGFVANGVLCEGAVNGVSGNGLPYGNETALVAYSDANQSGQGDTSQWINCTVMNYSGAQPAFLTHNDGTDSIASILLQNLVSIGSPVALEPGAGVAITVKGGLITDNEFDQYGSNDLIDGLTMTGDSAKIIVAGNSNTIQNCVLENTSQDGAIYSEGTNNLIRFNTLSMISYSGGALRIGSSGTGSTFYGNMITGTNHDYTSDGSASFSADYDFFDSSAGAPSFNINGTTETLAQFQSSGHETHGLTGNPLFVNAPQSNFQLQQGSPAVDKVPTAGITANSIPLDNAGNPRLAGPAYDIGAFELQEQAPTVATPAAANPNPVTGSTTALSVLGADTTDGESALTYSWGATGPATVTYTGNTNGTNTAKNITANFTKAGQYTITATITDINNNLTVTSSVVVTVNQTPTTVTVSPSSTTIPAGSTQQYSATAKDQFGASISSPTFTWSVTNGGSIDQTGLFTGPNTGGTTSTIKATDGTAFGTASAIIQVVAPATARIDAGGGAAGAFAADNSFSGGSTDSVTAAINTSLVTNPAPQQVYQSERYGNFTYTVTGLVANDAYPVRLHFVEMKFNGAGHRSFNVNINGKRVLTNFDIYANAFGKDKAIARQFSTTADSSGHITIQFISVVNNAQVCGIEVLKTTSPASQQTQLTGVPIGTAGSYQGAGNTITKAFDGNLSTYFDGPTANGDWLGMDLGAAHTITQISYAPRSGWASRMVGGIFQASNTADFSSGVVNLYTITATPVAGSLTTISLNVTTKYRYVRYLAPAGSYGDIAELKFWT
jgi:Malectin domain/F5/8 type C domain